MFKRIKHGVAETTTIKLLEEDISTVETEFNRNRITEIQNSWATGTQPLLRANRVYVREGGLQKLCRKGFEKRHFFLFNDILVYGQPLTKGTFSNQHVLALVDLGVKDLDDCEDYTNAFQIDHIRKSFIVKSVSLTDKKNWLMYFRKYIEAATGRKADEATQARAVWVPDAKVNQCMVCREVEFNLLQRKHHCRKCGKVVCGGCSPHKAILTKKKPERICKICFEAKPVIERTDAGPMAAKKETPKAVPRKAPVADDSDSSDYSSEEEDGGGAIDPVQAFLTGGSAKPKAAPRRTSPEKPASKRSSLTPDEQSFHKLSDEVRAQVMTLVKDGKLTIDEAMEKVTKERRQTGTRRNSSPPPRPKIPPASKGGGEDAEPKKPKAGRRRRQFGNSNRSSMQSDTSEIAEEDEISPNSAPKEPESLKEVEEEEEVAPVQDPPKPSAGGAKKKNRRRGFKKADSSTEVTEVKKAEPEPEPEPEPESEHHHELEEEEEELDEEELERRQLEHEQEEAEKRAQQNAIRKAKREAERQALEEEERKAREKVSQNDTSAESKAVAAAEAAAAEAEVQAEAEALEAAALEAAAAAQAEEEAAAAEAAAQAEEDEAAAAAQAEVDAQAQAEAEAEAEAEALAAAAAAQAEEDEAAAAEAEAEATAEEANDADNMDPDDGDDPEIAAAKQRRREREQRRLARKKDRQST